MAVTSIKMSGTLLLLVSLLDAREALVSSQYFEKKYLYFCVGFEFSYTFYRSRKSLSIKTLHSMKFN